MNLSEYRTDVRSALGIPAGDTSITDATIDSAINRALRDIANTADWPWLWASDAVALAAGASSFVPPTAWVRTDYLTESGRDLVLMSKRELATHSQSAAGRPWAYGVYGGTIRITPAADAAYTLQHGYTRTEPVLLSPSDSPLLPDAHSEWLVNVAASKLAIRTNNTERIEQYRAEATGARQRALDDFRRSRGSLGIRLTKDSVWPRGW